MRDWNKRFNVVNLLVKTVETLLNPYEGLKHSDTHVTWIPMSLSWNALKSLWGIETLQNPLEMENTHVETLLNPYEGLKLITLLPNSS